jgi:hypothetical protein
MPDVRKIAEEAIGTRNGRPRPLVRKRAEGIGLGATDRFAFAGEIPRGWLRLGIEN